MANNVTAIELSASGIRLVVGYVQSGKVYVLQALQGERLPLDADGKISVKASEESIELLFQTAKTSLGDHFDFGPVIAVYPSDGFKGKEGEGSSLTVEKSNRITQLDYSNCVNIIQKEVKEDGYLAVCCAPFLFVYDSEVKRDFLPGQISEKLSVKADCMLLEANDVRRYRKILNDIDIFPYLELVGVYASLEFLLGTFVPDKFLFVGLEEDSCSFSLVEERRLLFSQTDSFSLSRGVFDFAKRLSADEKTVRQYVQLFGFVEDVSNIPYPIPAASSEKVAASLLRECFSPLAKSLSEIATGLNLVAQVPLVVYGPGTDIPGIEEYLSNVTGRDAYLVNNNTIGARDPVFIGCLGGIKASNQPYQLSHHEGRQMADDEIIRKTYFGRN